MPRLLMPRLFMMGLLALISVANAEAAELRKINITQAVASFAFLPIDYAKAAGYFKDEGLDVQQIATRGGGPDLTALVSGDVAFNAAAGTYQISAIQRGRKIVNVYNFYRRNLIGVVISTTAAEKSGISSTAPLKERLQALKGLKIGMTRPGSLTDKQVRHLLRIGGLGPDDAVVVAIGGPPSLLSALEQGQIDGFAISVPHYLVAAKRGKAVVWVDNAKGDDPSIDPFMMESLLTTREFAQTNPEVVRAMVRAIKRAVDDIATKPAEEVRGVVQKAYRKVAPDVMLLGIEAAKGALNRKGDVSLQMAKNTLLLDGRKNVTPEQLFATFTPAFQ